MIKFYEVAPEHRESPIDDYDFEPGCWLEDVSVDGNKDYRSHKPDAFEKVERIIENGYDIEFVGRHFDIADWDALETAFNYMTEYKYRSETVITKLLQALTGNEYDTREIRGCVQGEWNRVYFPVSKGEDFVEWFETAYWNTGSEWIVEDGDSRISVYSCEWDEDKLKFDLASQYGVDLKDCEFYRFNGWKREPKYKKI